MKQERPRWLVWVTRVSLVLGLGALAVTVVLVGPAQIAHYLLAIGWFFVVIVTTELVSSVLDATAIYFLADGPSWRNVVVAQIAGRGVNSITPGGNLGEAVKVGLLSRHGSTRRSLAAVMYVDLIAIVIGLGLIAIGTAATPFLFDVPDAAKFALGIGAVISTAAAVVIVWLLERGMLATLANVLARLHIISRKRREKWSDMLGEVDARLSGKDPTHRRKAIACIVTSQVLQRVLSYLTVLMAGYQLGAGQFLVLLSAGVLVGWVSAIIPLGLGISEGGNVAVFTMIGAPASLGLALALARRVNQVVFATIGFSVLAADRVASHVHGRFIRTRTSH